MSRKEIPLIDIEQFLAVNHEQWHGEGFFITNDIYPYLQEHPNRLSFYAIALCNGGSYRTEINLQPYTLTANSFMAIKPHQTVNQQEITDYSGMLVLFNKNFFMRSGADLHLLESLQFFGDDAIPVVAFPETNARMLMDEFVLLRHKASRIDHPYRKEIVRNLLVNFLYECDVVYRRENTGAGHKLTHKEEVAREFQELVARHFRERHDVQFYAEALFISPKYLSELLRETLGRNASELIYEALLTEAAILLKTTSLTIAQIAATLHFSDASAFIHFFKKHTQQPPAAFRKG